MFASATHPRSSHSRVRRLEPDHRTTNRTTATHHERSRRFALARLRRARLGRDARAVGSPPRRARASWATSTSSVDELVERQEAAELAIASMGISFTVYSEERQHRPGVAVRRDPPGDRPPRVGRRSPSGLVQRLRALNLFIDDLYGDAKVLADGIVPAEIIAGSPNFRPECVGDRAAARNLGPHLRQRPRPRRRRHVLRARGQPAGAVGRVLHAREPPDHQAGVRRRCSATSTSSPSTATRPGSRRCSPRSRPAAATCRSSPCSRPGIYNSAYFEHAFLAQQMGALLVEGSDLVVDDDDVCRAHRRRPGAGRRHLPPGRRPVPRPRGLPARLRRSASPASCGRGGRATWPSPTRPAPASPTTRSSTPTCPELIRYYLGEDPLIAERADLRLPRRRATGSHVLDHLDELVVKPANESGGYGIFIGSAGHRGREGRAIRDRGAGRSPQLHRPADRRALDRPDPVRRPAVAPPRRPAPVHPLRRPALRHQRRAHPGRAARGLARREQLPGRRQQGHLDHRPDAVGRRRRRRPPDRRPRASRSSEMSA